MAKKNDGGGIQQAAGLIRYFDEESSTPGASPSCRCTLPASSWPVSSTWSTWALCRPSGAPLPESEVLNQHHAAVNFGHLSSHVKRRGHVGAPTKTHRRAVFVHHDAVTCGRERTWVCAFKHPRIALDADERFDRCCRPHGLSVLLRPSNQGRKVAYRPSFCRGSGVQFPVVFNATAKRSTHANPIRVVRRRPAPSCPFRS